ncbi:MAG: DUF2062 domain-containing protein [Burkholderiaceae bacterium]|nr:MAG: DUF2062 domain-containing protein [Burkholderiaceae bacterium]
MPRKFIRKYLPDAQQIKGHRWLRLFGDRLHTPSLWHLHRRSVASGFAIGLFCGLIPGPFQMLGAFIGVLILGGNLPVALVTTLYTNPFTIVPLYLIAYRIGRFALDTNHHAALAAPPEWLWSAPLDSVKLLAEWALSLGPALALGVFLLACLLAVIGYIAVLLLWSLYARILYQRRRKKQRRTFS